MSTPRKLLLVRKDWWFGILTDKLWKKSTK
jgi:hypothetical protein